MVDPNKCIMCGICIRACEELKGEHPLGFVGRGFEAVVAPTFEQPLAGVNYKACLECFAMCPLGPLVVPALQEGKKVSRK